MRTPPRVTRSYRVFYPGGPTVSGPAGGDDVGRMSVVAEPLAGDELWMAWGRTLAWLWGTHAPRRTTLWIPIQHYLWMNHKAVTTRSRGTLRLTPQVVNDFPAPICDGDQPSAVCPGHRPFTSSAHRRVCARRASPSRRRPAPRPASGSPTATPTSSGA